MKKFNICFSSEEKTRIKIICISVLIILTATPLSASADISQAAWHHSVPASREKGSNLFFTDVLIRIDTTKGYNLLPRALEVVGGKPGEYIDVILPRFRLHELSNAGIEYEVLIWDVDSYSQSFARRYRSLEEMENTLHDIAENYPDITRLYSIGKSYEGRDIWCLEITDNPGVDEEEPGVFYMGLHHAREWPTLEICLYIAEKLTSEYGSDPEITHVVDNRRLWLVPCVNPDGYYYCHDRGHDWRKNRHYFPEFNTYGVDLNRNYGGSYNNDPAGTWGMMGASHSPASEVYCGLWAFSELETQAIRNVFLENDISACITWHTYSELVLWPWAYTTSVKTPDDIYMAQVGKEIASRIKCQNGRDTYTPFQGAYLYPVSGDTTDWAYGHGHYVQCRPTFAYTIEACSSFHPAGGLSQICAENFNGALYLLQEAKNIRDTVARRVQPPVIKEMSPDPDGNYTVYWEEQNPESKPECFQLDELTGLTLVTDNAESGSKLWTLDGFSITYSKYHSGRSSFRSPEIFRFISSMTTTYPIPVTKDTSLSFWCYYNIRKYGNHALVEVSQDGRSYHQLDRFTGSSNGWEHKEYKLDEYSGESVFIRFTYRASVASKKDEFYIDDISPVADFGSVTTLTNSTPDNHYEITGRSNGSYFYRVRGYNSACGWGDFSTLKEIRVILGDNPPNTPTIKGPTSGKVGTEYDYTFVSTDPDGDNLYYYIEWGDDTVEEWIGPYASGEEITLTHTWYEKGTYTLRVKAKDTYGVESDWATQLISISKNKAINTILRNLERFNTVFPLLQRLLSP